MTTVRRLIGNQEGSKTIGETRQSIGRGVGLVLVALAAIACGPPFEFDEWVFPLPETIATHGYFPPTDEQRSAAPAIPVTAKAILTRGVL